MPKKDPISKSKVHGTPLRTDICELWSAHACSFTQFNTCEKPQTVSIHMCMHTEKDREIYLKMSKIFVFILKTPKLSR